MERTLDRLIGHGSIQAECIYVDLLAGQPGMDAMHTTVVVHIHPLGRQETGDAERMIRLRPNLHIAIGHVDGQVKRTPDGLTGQRGIQSKTGDVDIVVDGVGERQLYMRSHVGRLGVYTLPLRLHRTGHDDTRQVGLESTGIDAADIGPEVVGLIVDIVVAPHTGLRALVGHITRYIHAHRLQTHRGSL